MFPILAEAPPPDPEYLMKFLLTVSFLMNIGQGVWTFIGGGKKRDISPQPFTVKGVDEYVQRREFEEHKEHVRRVHGEIKGELTKRFDELREERRESITDLHRHIDSVFEKISDRLKEGSQTMVRHGEDIAALEAILQKGGKR